MSAGGHVLALRRGRPFRGAKDGTRVVSEEEASRRIFPAVGYAAQAVTPGLASNVATTFGTGFAQAFSLIFFSEIGDKTFFIAGLLAVKYGKVVSYCGSMAALVAMSVVA
eukprot:EG_transcript_20109